MDYPREILVGHPQDAPPPGPIPTPENPWYETIAVGAQLKVIRVGGLDVYTDSNLSAIWLRGALPAGDTSMDVAAPYDAAQDRQPPVGVLCVIKPGGSWPKGLWIRAVGTDGKPNVEIVP